MAGTLNAGSIIGKAKVRQLQRHENSQGTSEFSAFEYISAARNHFGISREEAERLTMTESVSYTHLTLPTTPYV